MRQPTKRTHRNSSTGVALFVIVLLMSTAGCEESPVSPREADTGPADTETDTLPVDSEFDSDSINNWDEDTEVLVDSDPSDTGPYDLLIIVEAERYSQLSDRIDQYIADIEAEGFTAYVVVWEPRSVQVLKQLIRWEVDRRGARGVWLIGDLPTAWFEQYAFDEFEQFPFDLYLMDLDNTFCDNNYNDVIDCYTEAYFTAEIFLSRLVGETTDIQRYFDKLHRHRTEGLGISPSAYVFMDDAWSMYNDVRRLNAIYDEVESNSDITTSTRLAYVNRLTLEGAQFVSQWIHSSVSVLYFEDYDANQELHISDIEALNFKGQFYNMFNCSSARFTEPNLSQAYLLGTDFGLATIGSTKIGGMYNDLHFHLQLAEGKTWGEAYQYWYNSEGNTDDEWLLGIVIHGDPLLRVKGESHLAREARFAGETFTNEMKDELYRSLKEQASHTSVQNFEEYREANPHFFTR